MNRRILVLGLALAAAVGVGFAAVSCNFADAVTCDNNELNLTAGTHGDFGSDAGAQKIEAFFDATIAVQNKAHALMSALTTACMNIGRAINLTDGEMQPTGSEPSDAQRIEAACTPVAAAIRETIQQAIPSGAFLSLQVTPPQCDASLTAYANCAAGCEVSVTPGELDVVCEPGRFGIGECGGSCSGECWVDASAGCTGQCSAQCTGTCGGTCYGNCTGTCDVYDGSGNCAGLCSAQCTGTCEGSCTGACTGECWADVDAHCAGECHGSCDIEWRPPQCEVYARPPEIDADCHASCEARVNASLSCTPGSVTVNYGLLGGNAAAQTRFQALVTALRANYGAVLLAARDAGAAIVDLVESFFDALDGIASAAATAVDAAACALRAFQVSFEVSATFSASATACGGMTAAVTVEGSASVGGS
ncbi:MAG: hypothetical protein HY905_25030 [Deltaproteobacteria bacterium]|nr:hypothetical protein [Deltaproteobacteria bacterium]